MSSISSLYTVACHSYRLRISRACCFLRFWIVSMTAPNLAETSSSEACCIGLSNRRYFCAAAFRASRLTSTCVMSHSSVVSCKTALPRRQSPILPTQNEHRALVRGPIVVFVLVLAQAGEAISVGFSPKGRAFRLVDKWVIVSRAAGCRHSVEGGAIIESKSRGRHKMIGKSKVRCAGPGLLLHPKRT